MDSAQDFASAQILNHRNILYFTEYNRELTLRPSHSETHTIMKRQRPGVLTCSHLFYCYVLMTSSFTANVETISACKGSRTRLGSGLLCVKGGVKNEQTVQFRAQTQFCDKAEVDKLNNSTLSWPTEQDEIQLTTNSR